MLIKDNFPLTHLFYTIKHWKTWKNNLYTRFSIETNGVLRLYKYASIHFFKENKKILPIYI